jgi:hypothetical protein
MTSEQPMLETVSEPPFGWPKDFGDMEEYPPGSGQTWRRGSQEGES